MKLPALLYGTGAATRREANKVISRLRQRRSIIEIVDELGGLVDVDDRPGLIILEGNALPGLHFRLYRVLSLIANNHWEAVFNPIDDALFDALVETGWGVAMMLCTAGRMFFVNHEVTLKKDRYRRFLDAAVHHWPAFEAASPRWSRTGYNHAGRPLDESMNLLHILQACNIETAVIRADAHLGLPEFLRRHPPEPEKYVQPVPSIRVLRTDEEKRESIRAGFALNYRQIVEDFEISESDLRQIRRDTDRMARAEGFDPAELDPYWHQRPGKP